MPYDNPLVDGTYKIKAGDRFPPFEATLKRHDGTVVDLTNATSATLHLRPKSPSADVESFTMAFVSPRTSGKVRYAWAAGETDTAGERRAEVEVTWNSGEEETFPGEGYIPAWFTTPLE